MQQEEQAKKDGAAETESQAGAAEDRKIKAKAKVSPAHPTLTAPQLVHYVAYAIQTEMPDLMFDYFAMHKMA
ncbi:bloom syndrome [Fusarium acutatum]|uniref:Bloom syndrome n=1 Tax=Fusarium acutatum TaxID=78861 RepID=A0A8H4JDN1_9HYPO|nr:bloom syndrome [Fusarium acutatum]